MVKPRILLHSMTFKRDFGAMFVLSKLLEAIKCECFIANNNNVCSKWVKLWNPHAVFYVTMSRTKLFKSNFPNAKLFLCSGEGGESREFIDEIKIVNDEFLLNAIHRIYLWGSATENYIKENIQDKGNQSLFFKDNSLFDKKFCMAGNPRIDLLKFCSKQKHKSKKYKVGLIGAFPFVNNNKRRLLSLLANTKRLNIKEDIAFQFRLLREYLDIIDHFDTDSIIFSLRPYPLESFEEYYNTDIVKTGKLLIDNSLDFSTWLAAQDVIIAPISSTVSQIMVSEKPFICLDKLCSRPEEAYSSGQIPIALKPIAETHSPGSKKELFSIIKKRTAKCIKDKKFKENLHQHYNAFVKHSVLFKIACDIKNTLEKDRKNFVNISLPYSILSLIDDIRQRYVEYRNPKIYDLDYSFFRTKKISSKADKELMYIVKNIVDQNKILIKK